MLTYDSGEVFFDHEKPDGTPRRLMDISKLTALGWTSKVNLEAGVARVYDEFQKVFK